MKDEIIEFFKSHNIPVGKIISIGTTRHGLTAEAIRAAMTEIYERRDDIKPIRLAWEVFSVAKHLKVAKEQSEDTTIKELHQELEKLHRECSNYDTELNYYKQQVESKSAAIQGLHDRMDTLNQEIDWYKTRNLWGRIRNKEFQL